MLNAEYINCVNSFSIGYMFSVVKQLAFSASVRRTFEDLLVNLRNAPCLLEEPDFDFMEWADAAKWQKQDLQPNNHLCGGDLFFTIQFNESLNAGNDDVCSNLIFKSLEDSIDRWVHQYNVEQTIEENIAVIRKTLSEIHLLKKVPKWGKDKYEAFYEKLHEKYIGALGGQQQLKEQHEEWLATQIGTFDMADLEQRRRELLIRLFGTGFLEPIRRIICVPASDDLSFGVIKDDALVPDLNNTLKYMAAMKKLCPLNQGMFSFNEKATLGKYIFMNNIPQQAIRDFCYCAAQIEFVQQEMTWLTHPGTKTKDNADLAHDFVERIKLLMKSAAESNNTYKTLTSRGHSEKYLYSVDAEGVCKLMDDLLATRETVICDYLADATKTTATSIKYVAPFIGFLLDTHVYTPEKMPKKELEVVFQKIYGSRTSAVAKMSNKFPSDEAQNLFNATSEIMKKPPKS